MSVVRFGWEGKRRGEQGVKRRGRRGGARAHTAVRGEGGGWAGRRPRPGG
jgi:hypothetical protein